MKVIVTGAKGQLGYDVLKQLAGQGHEPIGIDIEDLDITSAGAVDEFFDRAGAEAVIHCAAYTAVDAAEDNEAAAYKVNVEGTENIAKACRRLNMKMLYISTDYVFDGTGERPWEPEDERNPLSAYGRTKCGGELAVEKHLQDYFIVRISWVFGINGNNFVKTMLRLGREKGGVQVVDDQFGSPAYTKDLALLLADMIGTCRYGIYHASNEGFTSWYEFACEIFRSAGMPQVSVTPVSSSMFKAKAERPKNSRMSKEKLVQEGFQPLRHWKEALRDFMKELSEDTN